MTVTYTDKVATSSFSCFLKLLLRWRGSIYKLLWKDFLIFAAAYYTLNLIYRFALTDSQKRTFERVAHYCETYNNLIPVAFILGFYVSIVVTRWWDQFNCVPWPDRMAMFVTATVQGHDERGRVMRRTIMRYLCLSFVITMSSICTPVKKRFTTFSKMTEAGFMLPNEQKILEGMKTPYNKYFAPLAWCAAVITRARKENRIKDDFAVKTLIDEINAFRGLLGGLFNYDWISVPLVYTQVVTLAVYMFFISCLMGRQFLNTGGTTPDMYFPLFTFLQFFFYMGWLKVAECLVNPFGEDDDDFDINSVIDRNLQVSYLVVDEMHQEHPELIKDQYWDEVEFELPYSAATENLKASEPFLGSAMDINLSPDKTEFVQLASIAEEGTEPTGIPIHNHHGSSMKSNRDSHLGASPSTKSGMPLWKFMKRTISRDSRAGDPDYTPSLHRHRRRKRADSASSNGSTNVPSPSVTARTEDIFNMDDLDEPCEDELDALLDAALAEPGSGENKEKIIQHLIHTRAKKHQKKKSPSASRPRSIAHLQSETGSLAGSKAKLKDSHEHLAGGKAKLKGSNEHLAGSKAKLKDSHEHLAGSTAKLKDSHEHLPGAKDAKAYSHISKDHGEKRANTPTEVTVRTGEDGQIIVSPKSVSASIPVPTMGRYSPRTRSSMDRTSSTESVGTSDTVSTSILRQETGRPSADRDRTTEPIIVHSDMHI